jgi:hypothetical protein
VRLRQGVARLGRQPGLQCRDERLAEAPRRSPVVGPLRPVLDAWLSLGRKQLGVALVIEVPLPRQHVGVDRFVQQRVAELVAAGPFVDGDDIGASGLPERRRQRHLVQIGDSRQPVVVDAPATDGGDPENELRLGREMLDPRQHHVAQQRWKVVARAAADGAGQLFQEERVAFGTGEQRFGQRRLRCVAEHGREQRRGVRPSEPLQPQVDDVRSALELGHDPAQRMAGMKVVAAVRHDERHGRRRAGRRQVRNHIARRAIGPMRVLHDQ